MTRFGFILHALKAADAARKYPVARYLPDGIVEWLMAMMPNRFISEITGIESPTGARTEGCFIGCMLTSRLLLEGNPEKSTARIIDACKMAADHGAQIVGLGALTAVVGDKGITIAENVDIGVTTGNSYTVATAVEGLLKGAEMIGHLPASSTVAILGATGSIGKVCAKLLAPSVARLVLVGRRPEALEQLADELRADGGRTPEIEWTTDIPSALSKAPLVIAVTSALDSVVEPHDLLPGAVVCDVARPRDVSVAVAQKRADVLVIEGGAVAVPGDVDFHFDFGFPPKTAYACMAETIVLALEGRTGDYSLGADLSIERVTEISALARKHGFGLAGFRSFESAVTEETIDRVRRLAGEALQTYPDRD